MYLCNTIASIEATTMYLSSQENEKTRRNQDNECVKNVKQKVKEE